MKTLERTITIAEYLDGTIAVPEGHIAEYRTPLGRWPIVEAVRGPRGPIVTVEDPDGRIKSPAGERDAVYLTPWPAG